MFLTLIANASSEYDPKKDLPAIEVPIHVIQHYNKTPAAMKAFKDAGYFVFSNVKVYEIGHREEYERRDKMDTDQVTFRG